MSFLSIVSNDLRAFCQRDPAARSRWHVFFLYPGFHALLLHRMAHRLWGWGLHFLARLLSYMNRFVTHIEIHPAARLGEGLVIDHGAGLVIGETVEIGRHCTLYQGVTLGGLSPSIDSKAQVSVKRHPTLGDYVIVGSGAQVLGPLMVGNGARIGANAVVITHVKAGQTVVGIPARTVGGRKNTEQAPDFVPYGLEESTEDPLWREIAALRERIAHIEKGTHRNKTSTPS
ncbi:MAG: serine O-acetyltransferase [Alphaproteobacteria bacterium GM7ARS4]|nr:serine O-acetyltransferase [Alphaproteobacteria bacterium GM7ARS4]